MTAVRAFGPGRVNLIGEHTDYNDGLCLPFAIAAGVTVEATDGPAGRIDAHALDLGETDTFAVGNGPRDVIEQDALAEGLREADQLNHGTRRTNPVPLNSGRNSQGLRNRVS